MNHESESISGDFQLGMELHAALNGSSVHGACAALVSPDITGGSLTAGIVAAPESTFLVGSVGKAINGLVYSEMVADGTVSRQDTLERFFPLAGAVAGKATLDSLVTHTAGLPTIGGGRRATFRSRWRLLRSRDPQPETLVDLIEQLRKSPLRPGRFHYSNLGGAALGHALAIANGSSYPDLISDRVAKPLGCPSLYVPSPGEVELPGDVPGLSVYNTRQEPWTGEGYSPAGGIRASADDMAIVLNAVLNHPRLGWRDAFIPRTRVDSDIVGGAENYIGAGWFIQKSDVVTDDLVWHNGYANGFGSAIVLDRSSRRGVFISILDGTMQVDPVSAALYVLRQCGSWSFRVC